MARDYETPDDYADKMSEREANDDWCELQREADKEDAAFDDRDGGPEYEHEKWLHYCEMMEQEYEADRVAMDARSDVIDHGRMEH